MLEDMILQNIFEYVKQSFILMGKILSLTKIKKLV